MSKKKKPKAAEYLIAEIMVIDNELINMVERSGFSMIGE